jgi:hypothetical protein
VERCLACEAERSAPWSAASLARPMRSAPRNAARKLINLVTHNQDVNE